MITFDYLLPKTKEILTEISQHKVFSDFTFVGGSALACFLSHRLSEDLDFFTWENHLDTEGLLLIFNREDLQVINRSHQQTDLIYKGVKITFFCNKWEQLKISRSPLINQIQIASLPLLAAMKVNTLFLRAKYRDYYDLYCIVKEQFNIDELFIIASDLIPGLTKRLFQIALTYTDDIIDDNITHLSPSYSVTKNEIEFFFLKKIKEWNKK